MSNNEDDEKCPISGRNVDFLFARSYTSPPLVDAEETRGDLPPVPAVPATVTTNTTDCETNTKLHQEKEESLVAKEKENGDGKGSDTFGTRRKNSEDMRNSLDTKFSKSEVVRKRGSTYSRSASIFSKDLEDLMTGVENAEDAPPNLLHLREALESSSSSDGNNIISISEKCVFPSEGRNVSQDNFGWIDDPYNADGDRTPVDDSSHHSGESTPAISTYPLVKRVVTKVEEAPELGAGIISFFRERLGDSVSNTLLAEDSDDRSSASRGSRSPPKRRRSPPSQRTLTDVPIDASFSSTTDDIKGIDTASALSFPLRDFSMTESKNDSTRLSEKPSEKPSENTQAGKSCCEEEEDGVREPVHNTIEGIENELTNDDKYLSEEAAPSIREYAEKKYSLKNRRSFTILFILIPFILVAAFIPISMYWSTTSVSQAIIERSLREVNDHMQREIISYVDYIGLTPEMMLRLMAANLGVSTLNETILPFSLPSGEHLREMFCAALMRTSLRKHPGLMAYVSEDPNVEIAMCYRHNKRSALFTLLPQPNSSSPPLYSDMYRVDPFTLKPLVEEPYYRTKRPLTSRELLHLTGFTSHLKRWREEAKRDPGAVSNVTLSKKLVPFSIYGFAFPFYEPGKDKVSALIAMIHSREAIFRIRPPNNEAAFKKSRVMLLSLGTFHNVSTMGLPEDEDIEEEKPDMYLTGCNWNLCEERYNPLWFLSEDKKERINPRIEDIDDPLAKAALREIDIDGLTFTGGSLNTETTIKKNFPRYKIRFGNLTNTKFAHYKQFTFQGEIVLVSALVLKSTAGSSFVLVLATPFSVVHTKTNNLTFFFSFTVLSTLLVIVAVRYTIMRRLHEPLADICSQLEKAVDFCETKNTKLRQKNATGEWKKNGTTWKEVIFAWLGKVFCCRFVLTEIDEVKNECDVLVKRMNEVRQYVPDEIFPVAAESAEYSSAATKELSSDTDVSNAESGADDVDENFGKDVCLLGQMVHHRREHAPEARDNLEGKEGNLHQSGEKGVDVDHTGLTSQWLKSIHYMSNSAKKDPLSAHNSNDANSDEKNNSLNAARRPKALKLRKTQVQVSDVPARRPDSDVPEGPSVTGLEPPSTPSLTSGPDFMEEPGAASSSSPVSRQEEISSGHSGEKAASATVKSFSAFKLGIQEEGTAGKQPTSTCPRGNTEEPDSPLRNNKKKAEQDEQPEAAMTKNTFRYSKCFCTVVSMSVNFDRDHTPLQYVPAIEKLITDAATKYDGSIDIFAAEIFYISFGSRRHMKDHALNATRFAIDIIKGLTLDMLKYVTMVVDAGVYFTSIIGLPERKGFVAWGRPTAQLLRETQCLHGFHLLITEPTVLLLRNRFRLLPVDVCSMFEERGTPRVALYGIYKGSVKKKTWQAFSTAYMRFFKKVVARDFEEASYIADHIYGSKYFPLFGLRLGLMCAIRILLETPLSPSSSAEEKLRQLNEISVSYAQYLKDANATRSPIGFYLPSYIRLNVNRKGNNMLDMATLNYQLRFASADQEEFLQSMSSCLSSWAKPEYEEPHLSVADDDALIAAVSSSMSSDRAFGAVHCADKKEELLEPPSPFGEAHTNFTVWMKRKPHHVAGTHDMDVVPKAIPRFIEDNYQNVWRRSDYPMLDFMHPVFLCISQSGTLASLRVYDYPIRPDFWSTSLTSPTSTNAAVKGEEQTALGSQSDSLSSSAGGTLSHASFESAYARHFSSFTHENLLQFISVAYIPRQSLVCIVSEYVPGGTVADNSEGYTRRLPLAAIKQYCVSILTALDYLHVKKHVVHGRLNPHNILVGVDGHCKLKGMVYLFDWVRQTPSSPSTLLKNMASYNAPEINAGESRTPASDIYSFGLILLGMLCWSSPWAWVEGVATGDSLAETLMHDTLFLDAYKANKLKLRSYDNFNYLSSTSGSSSHNQDEDVKEKDNLEDSMAESPTAINPIVLDKALQKVLQRSLASNPEDRKSASSLLRVLVKAI